MPKYRLMISSGPIDFVADHPSEFLDVWRAEFRMTFETHEEFRRAAALLASDWSGKPIRYSNDDVIVWDMMEHGMLEEVHEKG